MMPFEALTEIDKEKIIKYVETYGSSDGETIPMKKDLDYILRFWNKSKENFFHMFGDKLMIKRTFKAKTSDDVLKRDIRKYLAENRTFYNAYEHWADHIITTNYPLSSNYDTFANRCRALSAVDINDLVSNRISYNFEYARKDGKVVKVPIGAKTMGVLGKIAKEFGLEGFEDFRIAISRFTEVRTEEVEITLSIHPLDFMTMSDNDNNWESCMNWIKGPGSYRAGTVEMLNSEDVIIAYITTKDMKIGDNMTWNSKSWRTLVIVDPTIISTIKGYPYQNRDFDKAIVEWLAELCEKAFDWHYKLDCPMEQLDDYEVVDESIWGEDYSIDFVTDFMYNDFGNTNNYAIFSVNPPTKKDICIHYSGLWSCMTCGLTYNPNDSDESSAVVCDECENIYYCSCCGERIYRDNYGNVDDEIYCADCYWDLDASMIDEEKHSRSNLVNVYVLNTEQDKIDNRYGGHFIAEWEIDKLKDFFSNPDLKWEWRSVNWNSVIVLNDTTLTKENLDYLIDDATNNFGFEIGDWGLKCHPDVYC